MQHLNKLAKNNTFTKSNIENTLLDAQNKHLNLKINELLGNRVHDNLKIT